jgi:hypothetical protein
MTAKMEHAPAAAIGTGRLSQEPINTFLLPRYEPARAARKKGGIRRSPQTSLAAFCCQADFLEAEDNVILISILKQAFRVMGNISCGYQ